MKKFLVILCSAFVFMMCKEKPGLDLKGTSWQVVEINGSTIDIKSMTDSTSFTIMFTQQDSSTIVNGRGDCNRFFGSYQLDTLQKTITFGQMGMTRALCPNDQVEQQFMTTLHSADHYDIENEVLYFCKGTEKVIKLKKINLQ